MQFDPANNIVQLCAKGMSLEASGKPGEAKALFLQAWNEATNDLEKFTAAHYVARHQPTIAEKLSWDKTALAIAMNIKDASIAATYPSLYLNIAKCYEELDDHENAGANYLLARSYETSLPDDGYGQMIRNGIKKGMERLAIS